MSDLGDRLNGYMAAIGLCVLAGCSTFENGSAYGDPLNRINQKAYDAPLNLKAGTKTVHLWLHTADEVKRICGGRTVMACAIPQMDGSWAVVSVAPKSWNDHIALAVLGHEFSHVFGSTHE